jgi:hypothetical protein
MGAVAAGVFEQQDFNPVVCWAALTVSALL